MYSCSSTLSQLIDITLVSWLHALFIGIDANFRLKRKNVSNDTLDPGLSRGWAYFVEDTAYQAHVTSDETPVEKSSCVSHKAVNDADKRPAKGLLVNGVGTVECTRHDFKRPLSVGDLRHGERYGIATNYLASG